MKKSNKLQTIGGGFLLFCFIALLSGCTMPKGENEIKESNHTNIQPVSEKQNEFPGLLAIDKAAIGNVHLGDSQRSIIQTLGIPDNVELNPHTGEKNWYFSKYDATLSFYQKSLDALAGGVVRIIINGQSNMKTDTGLGIGDSLQQIIELYPDINGEVEKDGVRTIWVNGKNKGPESSDQYYPTLKFELRSNRVHSIELSNRGANPGPFQQKPLTLADMKIGDIQIGDSSEKLIEKFGQPSKKTTVHGIGDPEWLYEKLGMSIALEPVWGIRVISPFSGSTPRGIKIGSTEDEVKKAYPDSFVSNHYFVQNSIDYVYQLVFDMENGVVKAIAIQKDLVLGKL